MKASFRIHTPAAIRWAAICGGVLVIFWGGGLVRAQAPAGPMPAHPEADAPPPQAPTQNTQSQSAPAKIAGTWKLNKDRSDDARKAMQAAGGGQGGGRGGRRGYGGRGGGNSNGGMMADYNQLTIVQSGSAVKITGSSGRVLAQSPSSSTDDKSKSSDSSESTPSGEWQGSQYVVMTPSDRGKTTRTYALSSESSQLILTTRIDSPRFNQPVTFRYVYDPVKGSSGAE